MIAKQQERLAKKRSVLILIDDVVLSGPAQDQLCTLAMRGRHFGISLMMACVSYTTLPKRVRRSFLVFSLPMKGDLKVLTWEYTNNTRVAEFALRRLEDHQCLVLETLTKRQKLAVWKATFFTENDVRKLESPPYDLSRTTVFDATREEYPSVGDLSNKRAPSSYRRYQEDFERAEVETSENPQIEKSGNDQEDPE